MTCPWNTSATTTMKDLASFSTPASHGASPRLSNSIFSALALTAVSSITISASVTHFASTGYSEILLQVHRDLLVSAETLGVALAVGLDLVLQQCVDAIVLLLLASLGGTLALNGCGTSNRFVQQDGTPPGTYAITVIGTSGTLTHTVTVQVVVR